MALFSNWPGRVGSSEARVNLAQKIPPKFPDSLCVAGKSDLVSDRPGAHWAARGGVLRECTLREAGFTASGWTAWRREDGTLA